MNPSSQASLRAGEPLLHPAPNGHVAVRPRLRLLSFKPLRKNSLIGFANVELPIALLIADIPILTSHGKIWAAMPGKPFLDAKWPTGRGLRQTPMRHSATVSRQAVRGRYPDALDDPS
jgi:hypothetical protein